MNLCYNLVVITTCFDNKAGYARTPLLAYRSLPRFQMRQNGEVDFGQYPTNFPMEVI